MIRISRRTVVAATASALCAGALVAPQPGSANAHAAKTYKLLTHNSGTQKGTKLTGKSVGKPFGTCHFTGTLVIPKTFQTWKCHGGNVKVVGFGKTGAADHAKGTWKITGGTGKYKHAKGHGTFSGVQHTGKFTYKGTVSF